MVIAPESPRDGWNPRKRQVIGCVMSLSVHALSTDLFVRGLTNLKAQLTKAEDQAAASGRDEVALLNAKLAAEAASHPADLHGYTLGAQVHWAAEGAKLAIAHLLGAPAAPGAPDEKTFADLHQRLDATIAYLQA